MEHLPRVNALLRIHPPEFERAFWKSTHYSSLADRLDWWSIWMIFMGNALLLRFTVATLAGKAASELSYTLVTSAWMAAAACLACWKLAAKGSYVRWRHRTLLARRLVQLAIQLVSLHILITRQRDPALLLATRRGLAPMPPLRRTAFASNAVRSLINGAGTILPFRSQLLIHLLYTASYLTMGSTTAPKLLHPAACAPPGLAPLAAPTRPLPQYLPPATPHTPTPSPPAPARALNTTTPSAPPWTHPHRHHASPQPPPPSPLATCPSPQPPGRGPAPLGPRLPPCAEVDEIEQLCMVIQVVSDSLQGIIHLPGGFATCQQRAPEVLVLFWQLVLGLLVPVYLAYRFELAARIRFVTAIQVQANLLAGSAAAAGSAPLGTFPCPLLQPPVPDAPASPCPGPHTPPASLGQPSGGPSCTHDSSSSHALGNSDAEPGGAPGSSAAPDPMQGSRASACGGLTRVQPDGAASSSAGTSQQPEQQLPGRQQQPQQQQQQQQQSPQEPQQWGREQQHDATAEDVLPVPPEDASHAPQACLRQYSQQHPQGIWQYTAWPVLPDVIVLPALVLVAWQCAFYLSGVAENLRLA